MKQYLSILFFLLVLLIGMAAVSAENSTIQNDNTNAVDNDYSNTEQASGSNNYDDSNDNADSTDVSLLLTSENDDPNYDDENYEDTDDLYVDDEDTDDNQIIDDKYYEDSDVPVVLTSEDIDDAYELHVSDEDLDDEDLDDEDLDDEDLDDEDLDDEDLDDEDLDDEDLDDGDLDDEDLDDEDSDDGDLYDGYLDDGDLDDEDYEDSDVPLVLTSEDDDQSNDDEDSDIEDLYIDNEDLDEDDFENDDIFNDTELSLVDTPPLAEETDTLTGYSQIEKARITSENIPNGYKYTYNKNIFKKQKSPVNIIKKQSKNSHSYKFMQNDSIYNLYKKFLTQYLNGEITFDELVKLLKENNIDTSDIHLNDDGSVTWHGITSEIPKK